MHAEIEFLLAFINALLCCLVALDELAPCAFPTPDSGPLPVITSECRMGGCFEYSFYTINEFQLVHQSRSAFFFLLSFCSVCSTERQDVPADVTIEDLLTRTRVYLFQWRLATNDLDSREREKNQNKNVIKATFFTAVIRPCHRLTVESIMPFSLTGDGRSLSSLFNSPESSKFI